jgi:orotidine-5'-phosphate decarboxylase
MNAPAATPTINIRDRLIIALDYPDQKQALDLVAMLGNSVATYKIGLQLYTAAGPEIVRRVAATGARIFLDLKLHDIPNTVAKAVAAANDLEVQMLTLHLSGGRPMLEAAAKAKSPNLLLLGVTVLTSMTEETLHETGISSGMSEHVVQLGELGKQCGIGGLITSPHEVPILRQRLGNGVKLVTPGVRPNWAEANDQKRFTTPRAALESGADFLVIGRPVTAASDPRAAMERLISEVAM